MGTRVRAAEYHEFRFSSRHVRDYRLEVLFATVDVPQIPYLNDAVKMTRYAEQKWGVTLDKSRQVGANDGDGHARDFTRDDEGSLSRGLRPEELKLLKEARAAARGSIPRSFGGQ